MTQSTSRMQGLCRALLILAWLGALAGMWFNRPSAVAAFVAWALATYLLFWGLAIVASGKPVAFWAVRFVAVGFSLLFAAAAAELLTVLRIADFRSVFGVATDEPWHHPVNRLDPELLHVRKPNLHLVGTQKGGDIGFYNRIPDARDYPYDVHYDANGFRNAKTPTEVEVAVIGDSFIEAFAVNDDELVTTQLAKLRRKPVANFGQIWYGPQQELAVLRRYVVPLKPKYCVWCLFEGNDLSDMRRYDVIAADWPKVSARLDSVYERSFIRNAILAGFERIGTPPARPDGASMKGTVAADAGKSFDLYFYYPGRKLDETDEAPFQKLLELLGNGASDCAHVGTQLVVAVVPTKYRVYSTRTNFRPGSLCRLWTQSDFAERLEKSLKEKFPAVGFVDLGVDFRAEAGKSDPLYFADDTHWSPAGHKLAARLIDLRLQAMPK